MSEGYSSSDLNHCSYTATDTLLKQADHEQEESIDPENTFTALTIFTAMSSDKPLGSARTTDGIKSRDSENTGHNPEEDGIESYDTLLNSSQHTQFCVVNNEENPSDSVVGTVTLVAEPIFSSQKYSQSPDSDNSFSETTLGDSEFQYQQVGYFNPDRWGDRPGTPVPKHNASIASQMSSCSDILPVCRFCHQYEEHNDPLFAPCRCSGSLQYIHHSCLLRWIEICTNKSRKPPKCEICDYQFHRHKSFKFKQWQFPHVSRQDKCLHLVFVLNLFMMIGCATATIMCFLSDKGHISKFPKNKMHLSTEEIITLSCGVLFFISFFIAMSVEIKAKQNIYKLFLKFLMMSMSWEIEEYDKRKDIEESLLLDKKQNCA